MQNIFSIEGMKSEIGKFNNIDYDKDGIKLIWKNLIGAVPEYFNKWFWCGELNVPIFTIDDNVWMSLTPMEIQSNWLPICMAEGRVATSGIGLGYFISSAMEREEVESIDAYEIDNRVISYFNNTFNKHFGFNKVNVIEGDVRKMMVGKQYDFVYMDPYKENELRTIIEDITKFTVDNKIKEYRFWGLEKVKLAAIWQT